MENIQVTYSELAFLMNEDVSYCKEIFLKVLKEDTIKSKEVVKVSELTSFFKSIRSVDSRYDGQNELVFNINQKTSLYKKYLSDKSSIKAKKFTGGKSISYKICSEDQLRHAEHCLNESFKFLYPKGLNPKKIKEQ